VLENCVNKEGVALLYAYQQEKGKKIVSDWDDFIYANESSPHKKLHEITQFPEVSKIVLEISDMLTVTTDYLAKKYAQYNKNIVVLENNMDLERWDIPKKNNTSGTIRIGWAGSLTHHDDLKLIEKPLKKILREFPHTQFVFVGDMRFIEMFEGYNIEAMLGVPFDYWPDKLNGLQLDIGVAPLLDNEFNRCKSNIKWQEYSIARVAGIYSPTVYQKTSSHVTFDGNIGMIANNEQQWYMCLRNYVICEQLRKDIADRAYSFVHMEFDLEKNIDRWVEAYSKLTQ
jgi:glycosyltransferase involved in cell wall biosynthesis